MRAVIQLLYRLKRTFLRVTGLKTRGVKVMLFNAAGELLLIRNSYGKTHLFVLPGGGIRRSETPTEAAAREVREEVGIAAECLALVSIHSNWSEGKRDTIHLFTAFTDQRPRADSFEVEEARFFSLQNLPDSVSAATLRRIAEHQGELPRSAAW